MVAAVLFDIGGVLVSSPFDAFARYEEARGLPNGFIRRVNAANHHDNAWAKLERGELDSAGFAAAFEEESAALGQRVSGSDVLSLLAGEIRSDVLEAVMICSRRLKTALLTNNITPLETHELPDDLAQVLDAVDVVMQSSVEGIRKPEPEFYLRACDRLEVEPHQCVFLDDLGVNLKPARRLGMTTIKVDDPTEALKALEGVVAFRLT